MRTAERLRELEKSGLPENYDRLSVDARDRIDAKIRKRKSRDKKRMSVSEPHAALLPVTDISPDMLSSTLTKMSRSLENWVTNYSTPLSRQLRNSKSQKALIRVAAAYARYFSQHHRPPSHAQLAKWLAWSPGQVRRKLEILKSLYALGGPWASK